MAIAITTGLQLGRLGKQTRKAVLVTHIVSAGAWIGLDVAMAAIVFTAIGTDDATLKALCYQALERFVYWPIFASSVLCLASGVVLGLGTSYGLTRYWWVAIKLVLNSILTTLVIFALRPGVVELAEQGRQAAAGQAVTFVESGIIFPPIVSSTALLIAFVLSVFKPWGRIRSGTPTTRRRTATGKSARTSVSTEA